MKTTLEKIYAMIKKSENPLIFFDDDPDGLCSYLLIKKHFRKGNPVAIRSSPKLDISYLKKISEYSPDLVIVLDKPIIPQEFIDQVNVPIIWIDHHPVTEVNGINYFNPMLIDKDDYRPVSYWCYELTKENLWIAAIGVLADYSTELLNEFHKKFPDLCPHSDDPGKAMFETKIGKLIKIFGFILKDSHYKVLQYVNLMEKIESPYELLDISSRNAGEIMKVYEKVSREYDNLLEKALQPQKSRVHVFLYSHGKMSFTGELANEIKYHIKNKLIIVGREKNDKIKMSLRYDKADLRTMLEKALHDLDGYGGGHKYACGANLNSKDFREFVERLESYIK